MKAFIVPSYTFTPGASGVGTIDLSSISGFDIKRLIAIINQTDGILIYSTASETLKHTGEAAGVVTLNYDTSAMDAGDDLQIVYEVPDSFATSAKQDDSNTKLDTLIAKDFATSAKQDTLIAKDFATSAKQDTANTSLASIDTKLSGSLTVVETALSITFQEILNLTTSAQTFTAPAGAKWMLISTDDTNTANIRVKIGGTATVSSGVQFQPGRSEMIKGGGNISVIAESGSDQKINVQFGA